MTPTHLPRALSLIAALLCAAPLPACGGSDEAPTVSSDVSEAGAGSPAAPAASAAAGAPGQPAAPAPDPETVLLTVNGADIKQEDFDEVLNQYLRGAAASMPPQKLAMLRVQLGPQIEERLIMQALMDGAVETEGTAATDEEVKAEWARQEKRLPPNMTIDDALTREGLTRDDFDQRIRRFLGHKKLVDKVAGDKTVTDEEARQYYDQHLLEYQTPEQVSARHILFRTDSSTPEEKIAKKKEIDALREKLVAAKGEGFEDLAKKHSDCPSGGDGGSLGSFGRGAMVPEFDKMAFELPVGEISPVIETQFGYHVIKVDKKTEAGTRPFEDVAEEIKTKIANEEKGKLLDAYREGLKKKATIVRHTEEAAVQLPALPEVNAGAQPAGKTAPADK